MRDRDTPRKERISLYMTPEHECSYLPDRQAQTLFVDPSLQPDYPLYQFLLESGFRRSGNHVYRPECLGCRACVPVRIPVNNFKPRRNQKRCWKSLHDKITVVQQPPEFRLDHYRLYLNYTASRHPDGGMADADPDRYLEFLTTQWCDSRFVEFRLEDRLLAVAVTDLLPHALSAVYTFFDPERSELSPGTYAILWQIEQAKRLQRRHLYLGYWIDGSDKMHYKANFRPIQGWDGNSWQLLAD